MKLSHFNFFELPQNLIAEHPTEERDESRLMVIDRKKQTIKHKIFKDALNYFEEEDVMIFNNTKVFPARLLGQKEKTDAKIELFLLRELSKKQRLWDALVDPARKIRIGNKLFFGEDQSLVAEVIDNTTSRGRTIRFLFDGSNEELSDCIRILGKTPLPKYIKREVTDEDILRYQTVFAKDEGAVAAPTAGLHFSKNFIKRLKIKGIQLEELTLHIGLGTFSSVEVEDLSKHKMHSEQVIIPQDICKRINKAKDERRRICAVGTTVMRSLESSISPQGYLNPFDGWTNKFIFSPYEYNIANAMITNFHMPKSTLLMMVSAFCGHDLLKKAYKEAIKEKYRFYSYGDAMLII